MLNVHASNYGGTITATKTEAGERFVPLFESARKALAEAKLLSRFARLEDFVFATIVGTPLDPGNFVRREFKPALARAGARALPLPRPAPLRRLGTNCRGSRHQALAGNRRACLGDDDARHLRPLDDGAGAGSGDALRPTRRELCGSGPVSVSHPIQISAAPLAAHREWRPRRRPARGCDPRPRR